MPGDALVNTGAPEVAVPLAVGRVLGIQSKLHDWAAADPGRQFDDLFNLVVDPAFLAQAWRRVRENTGARSAGVDGFTASGIENISGGVAGFLAQLRVGPEGRDVRPVARAGTHDPETQRETASPGHPDGPRIRRGRVDPMRFRSPS